MSDRAKLIHRQRALAAIHAVEHGCECRDALIIVIDTKLRTTLAIHGAECPTSVPLFDPPDGVPVRGRVSVWTRVSEFTDARWFDWESASVSAVG
jgi:hypothetical protein